MSVIEYVEAFISLLAGLGAFIIGFKLLSDNIEKLFAPHLRNLFDRTEKNRMVGVGVGIVATAAVQSSAVTTVMVVGFVNSGLMTLFSATAIIMGANIGTTITGQIAALGFAGNGWSFDLMLYVAVLACVGAFINMLAKKDNVKSAGLLIAGLGLIFLGLRYMSVSVSGLSEEPAIQNFLASVGNPFLLLLIGIVLTALVQSSSVVTSLVIVMAGAGMMIGDDPNDVLFLILGSNIGSCVTVIVSSFGASRNAKRAALIHVMFNTFGCIVFGVILLLWKDFMTVTFAAWFSEPAMQIAMFHTAFNIICMLLFVPFIKGFVWIAMKLIPDKKEESTEGQATLLLDERIIMNPAVALGQANRAASRLAALSMESLKTSVDGFLEGDESLTDRVMELNTEVAELDRRIVTYLVKISSQDISTADENMISAIHQSVGDILRISELADNITHYTRSCARKGIEFSQGVMHSVRGMYEKIETLYGKVMEVYDKKDYTALRAVDSIESEIDACRKELISDHIERLNEGTCRPESSAVFINLVGNLERAADHLTYVAHAFD